MRWLAVLTLWWISSTAAAQTAFDDHGRAWFGAEFALAPVGRYTRDIDAPNTNDRATFGGSLAASAYYVGLPFVGFGAHVSPGIFDIALSDVNGRVFLVDVGVDVLLRLAWKRADLTLRVPFGLSTGRLNWLRDQNEMLSPAPGGNDLGVGVHGMVLLGGVAWLSENTGLRLEVGPALRRMTFDEGVGWWNAGVATAPPQRGEVVHRSWSLVVSIGFVRRFVPRPPDDNGPPLVSPEFSNFR
jgi:hypothetical protein